MESARTAVPGNGLVSRSRDRLRLLLEGLGGRGDDLQLDLLNLPAIGADIPEFVIARSRVPLRGMAEKKIRASIEERCDRAVRAALSPFLGALRTWVERQTVWLERQFVLHARSASMAREKGVPPDETVTADLDAIRAAANAKPTAERVR